MNSKLKYSKYGDWEKCYTSEIFLIEVSRVLNRLRLEKNIDDSEYSKLKRTLDETEQSLNFVELNHLIKKNAASPFPTIIGTLDAIHLASALALKEEMNIPNLILLTHDLQLSVAARSMGLNTMGI